MVSELSFTDEFGRTDEKPDAGEVIYARLDNLHLQFDRVRLVGWKDERGARASNPDEVRKVGGFELFGRRGQRLENHLQGRVASSGVARKTLTIFMRHCGRLHGLEENTQVHVTQVQDVYLHWEHQTPAVVIEKLNQIISTKVCPSYESPKLAT